MDHFRLSWLRGQAGFIAGLILTVSCSSGVDPADTRAVATRNQANPVLISQQSVVSMQGICTRMSDQTVRCAGRNDQGQLGIGTSDDSYHQNPVTVQQAGGAGAFTGVVHLAAGTFGYCGALSDGSAWCWGDNRAGQIGDGTYINKFNPVRVRTSNSPTYLTGVIEVTAGDDHTCALLVGGAVRCWGSDVNGQLGDGPSPRDFSNVAVSVPITATHVQAGGGSTCAISGGQVYCWGYMYSPAPSIFKDVPTLVQGLPSNIKALSMSGIHACALADSGEVYCWGNNSYGSLGQGNSTSVILPPGPVVVGLTDAVDLAKGGANTPNFIHTCALRANGAVVCWGLGSSGQIGNGASTLKNPSPVQVLGLPDPAVSLSAGGGNSCAVLTTGAQYCWGDNYYGQLGIGSRIPANTARRWGS